LYLLIGAAVYPFGPIRSRDLPAADHKAELAHLRAANLCLSRRLLKRIMQSPEKPARRSWSRLHFCASSENAGEILLAFHIADWRRGKSLAPGPMAINTAAARAATP